MKKFLALFEILILILFDYMMVWSRFNGKLSRPFHLSLDTINVQIAMGLTLCVLVRVIILFRYILKGEGLVLKNQSLLLLLMLAFMARDLHSFSLWFYYVDEPNGLVITLIPLLFWTMNLLILRKPKT